MMKAVEDVAFDQNSRTMDQKVLSDYLYPYLGGNEGFGLSTSTQGDY
jgi:hypothetical protein